MADKIKFKITSFLVRRTFTCTKCNNFNARKCPVMADLLNQDDTVVFNDSWRDNYSMPQTFTASMDDMAKAWLAYQRCKKIAANCCQEKVKLRHAL